VWIIPATEISKAHDFSAKPINDPNVYIHGLFLSDSLLLKTALNENCSRPLLIQMTDVWTTRKDSSDVASSDMHPQQLLPDTYSTCNEKGASQPFAVKHSYG